MDPKKRRKLKLAGRVFGAMVLLSAPAVDDAQPFWVQIAQAGVYKGYKSGPVTFDAGMFNKVIANFRSHPWYQVDAAGIGMARVIPYDYEHASEMDPTEGSIPKGGAPAPAWALELQMRDGGELGPQLWALTDPVNDEVRISLKQGGYRSTSVAIWNNAIDGLSGDELGPVLTSIAFTNHPFIEGMAPIAARVDVWGQADSPEELIVGLRDIFELDENAPPADIQAQLVALGVAFANGMLLPAYPEGVGCLIDRVRQLIGLPVLSTAPQIIEAAGQVLTAVPTSQPPADPATPPAPSQGSYGMKTAIARIAILFKLNEAAAEEVILAAVEKAVEKDAANTDAISQLQALFGSSDMKDCIAKAGVAITAAESVKDLVASLQAAQDKLGEADKDAAAGEVEQVAASLGLSDMAKKRLVPTLLSQRIEAGKDETKLAKWREENGVKPGARVTATAPKAVKLLTSTMLAGRTGAQLGNAATFADTTEGDEHPLLACSGRNQAEKARNYLLSKRAGFDKLSPSKQMFEAGKYLTQGAPVL